jgi:hypothetical protein
MKKQILGLGLGLALTVGYGHFPVHAAGITDSQVVDPSSPSYDTARLIENSVYDLTDDSAVKALLQSNYAEQRAEESNLALQSGDTEQAQELINESNDSAEQATADLSEAKSNNEDVASIVQQLQDNYQTRIAQLTSLSANLPKQAQAGIAKAISNQKAALDKAVAAITGAPVPGDNQENQDKASSQMKSDAQNMQGDGQEKSSVQEQHASNAKVSSQMGKSDDNMKENAPQMTAIQDGQGNDSQTTASQDNQNGDQKQTTVTQNEDSNSSTVMGDNQDKPEVSKEETSKQHSMSERD